MSFLDRIMNKKSFFITAVMVVCFCPSALQADQQGQVYGWGWIKLLNGETLTDITQIAAGGYHNRALKSDGSIVGWGRDTFGQATPPDGNDYVAIPSNPPTPPPSSSGSGTAP